MVQIVPYSSYSATLVAPSETLVRRLHPGQCWSGPDAAGSCPAVALEPPETSATGSARPPRPEYAKNSLAPAKQGTFDQCRPELRQLVRDAAVDDDLAEAERCAHQRSFPRRAAATRERVRPQRLARSLSPRQRGSGVLANMDASRFPPQHKRGLSVCAPPAANAACAVGDQDRSLRRGMIVLCLPSIGLLRCDVSSVWLMQCWWDWGRCWARVCSLLGGRRPQLQALDYKSRYPLPRWWRTATRSQAPVGRSTSVGRRHLHLRTPPARSDMGVRRRMGIRRRQVGELRGDGVDGGRVRLAGASSRAAVLAAVLLTAVNYRGVTKTAAVTRVLVVVTLLALGVVVVGSLAGGATDRPDSRRWVGMAPMRSCRPLGCCFSPSPATPGSPHSERRCATRPALSREPCRWPWGSWLWCMRWLGSVCSSSRC